MMQMLIYHMQKQWDSDKRFLMEKLQEKVVKNNY